MGGYPHPFLFFLVSMWFDVTKSDENKSGEGWATPWVTVCQVNWLSCRQPWNHPDTTIIMELPSKETELFGIAITCKSRTMNDHEWPWMTMNNPLLSHLPLLHLMAAMSYEASAPGKRQDESDACFCKTWRKGWRKHQEMVDLTNKGHLVGKSRDWFLGVLMCFIVCLTVETRNHGVYPQV